ncbi:hypothetical protein [Natranaerobius thermophilus]|uniref:Uncharacterized protein n=1 Tax=Natranaerobius thermophilus (strain ATCC BAA-1301 / DSM 18059 / JW/NM-WN-LF) TaxID=457570 RepID=B2A411_NATTJ|nr:hypothetical protein [Natranaerobius thermophilus]ACB85113.1 hypothetical protein Nther_1535 [Natranaerobius thermophilus JW/NM-WN-LF]
MGRIGMPELVIVLFVFLGGGFIIYQLIKNAVKKGLNEAKDKNSDE